MADREKILEDILGVLPDMSPPWLQYQIALHLAIDPNPSHTQMRILDSAFAYGYVKVAEQPVPPGIPPIPRLPIPATAAAAVPLPPVQPPQPRKRKASEPTISPNKKQALDKTVDFTQVTRPFVQGRDFKYQELSLSYLNAELANLPNNHIRRQFHRFQYLVPAYLALRQQLASGALDGSLLKKRRNATGPVGAECEPSPLFLAEKRALDSYIASGCKNIKLLREAAPPQEVDLTRPRTPIASASRSSSRSSSPFPGPSQSTVPNSTQSSRTSLGSPVKRWSPPNHGVNSANQGRESRSPSPLARQHHSRSPTPIEIETQATDASVVVIESQDSDIVVIESQRDELEVPKSPPPARPANLECGCCFTEYEFSDMLQCAEGHLFCPQCTKKNAETAVGDNKPEILCMDQSGCRAPFPDEQIQRVLPPNTIDLLQRIRQKKAVDDARIPGLEHCPFCDYAYIITDGGPTFVCQKPSCMVVSCRRCRRVEHGGMTCEQVIQREKSSQGEHAIAEAMTMALVRDCPECKTPFMKETGCNKMVCPKCETVSCYICRQKVSQISPYTHFDRDPDAYDLPPDNRKCPLWDIDRAGRAGGSPTPTRYAAVDTSDPASSPTRIPPNTGFQDAGDFTLISSPEDVEFKVFRLFLMTASPVFQDILTSGSGPPVMKLSEDAETVAALLQYIYPRENPTIKSYVLFEKVLEAARKYELGFITSDLRASMRSESPALTWLRTEPLRIYALAVRHELKEEIAIAAKLTIGKYDFASAKAASELCALNIPSRDAVMLMRMHMARAGALSDLLVNAESNPRYFAGFPVKCDQCKHEGGSASELQKAWMKEAVALLRKEPLDKAHRLFEQEFFLGLKLRCRCARCRDADLYDRAHKVWAEECREKLVELKLDDL
ncbi:endoplasmic reticulum membrane protein [Rhizoctonia solani]|uniref:Endoplasmic reticulum membrane protein n=1 Tax=Rhizoctonia solani TaxID=456999 RepID=A0A8H8T3Z0_9AGAM|nr:endoplasmic reticulum membrane protein [Rhizoctonia solani]QRW27013.1 endoplasmic reticulum membrane protein [Rhizoctonia solani]